MGGEQVQHRFTARLKREEGDVGSNMWHQQSDHDELTDATGNPFATGQIVPHYFQVDFPSKKRGYSSSKGIKVFVH